MHLRCKTLWLCMFLVPYILLAEGTVLPSTGERITLDFRDAHLEDVFRSVADISGINIVCDGTVGGKVTVRLREVTLEEAVSVIAGAAGFRYRWVGDNLLVGSGSWLEEEDVPRDQVEVIRAQHIEVETLGEVLSGVVEGVRVGLDAKRRRIVLRGDPECVEEARDLIARLDRPSRQVLIEVKAVIMSHEEGSEIGVQAERGMRLKRFGGGPVMEIDLLKLREGAAQTEILARPRILTLDGREAKMLIGQRVPYRIEEEIGEHQRTRVESFEAGIRLVFRPQITDADEVKLEIRPEVSTFEWREDAELPQVSTRELETTLRVPCGETFVLGGLIKDEEREVINAIPILGELPLLGVLFRHRKREDLTDELFLFITPHILEEREGEFPEAKLRGDGREQPRRPLSTPGEETDAVRERFHPRDALVLFGLLLMALHW